MTSTAYPNGQVLISSALGVSTIQATIQQLTLGMIGQNVTPNSSAVRVQWPLQGAPFQPTPSMDIGYIRCTPFDGDYDKIRDRMVSTSADTFVTESQCFTREWRVCWTFYGPNSTDLCRQVRDALYQDYFTIQLAMYQLFPESDFPMSTRVPENIDGQWFDRSDQECTMYEFVSESIQTPAVAGLEVIIEEPQGIVAEVVVN